MLQYILTGLAMGSLYALLGLGLVITNRTTNVLNFAHGEMAMVLTFVCYFCLATFGLGTIASFAVTLLAGVVLGLLVYNLFIHPQRKRDHESLAILTLGMKLALSGIVAWALGAQARVFPQIFAIGQYHAGSLTISVGQFWTIVLGLVAMCGTTAFLRYTKLGLAMRASAENIQIAQLLGINLRVVGSAAWVAASCLAAVTGVLLATTIYLTPFMMGLTILKAFAALVVGGMTSVPGVIAGGLLLGLLEGMVAYTLTPVLQESVALVLVILVLLVRPQGLFGRKDAWRA
jgi:branched-chain amino acid transport system permease protein